MSDIFEFSARMRPTPGLHTVGFHLDHPKAHITGQARPDVSATSRMLNVPKPPLAFGIVSRVSDPDLRGAVDELGGDPSR